MQCAEETSTKEFCDTIATCIARYEKYHYWVSKGTVVKFSIFTHIDIRALNQVALKVTDLR